MYATTTTALSFLCVGIAVFAVIRHSFSLMIVGIFFIVATTFFASASKFAKEVTWIFRWRRVTGCPIDEYPQTKKQAVIVRRKLYPELHRRAMELNSATLELAGARMRRDDVSVIASLVAEECARRMVFLVYWSVLRRVGSLPIDFRTAKPWADSQGFLESVSSVSALAYA